MGGRHGRVLVWGVRIWGCMGHPRRRFYTSVTWMWDSSDLFPRRYPAGWVFCSVSPWFLFVCYRPTRPSVSWRRGQGVPEGS